MPGRVFLRGEIYWIAFSHNGKEYRKSAKTEKKREAESVLSYYLGQCARGEFKGFQEGTKTYSINEMLDDLLSDCEQRQLRSLVTVRLKTRHLREELGDLAASELTERHIDLYVKKRFPLIAASTMRHELIYLKQAFRLAARKHLVEKIPYFPTITVQNARQGFFEANDFERVVGYLAEELKDVMRFAYYSGWRKGEILTLEWRDVQGEVIRLRPEVSKNKEGRVLAVVGEIAAIIERRRAQRLDLIPWVFHRNGGKRIKDFRLAWRNACKRAGVDDKLFHDFRRTAVRNMTRAGVPEKIAMSITGHKTRAVFDRYNIVNEEDIRQGLERTFEHLSDRQKRVTPLFSDDIGQKTHK